MKAYLLDKTGAEGRIYLDVELEERNDELILKSDGRYFTLGVMSVKGSPTIVAHVSEGEGDDKVVRIGRLRWEFEDFPQICLERIVRRLFQEDYLPGKVGLPQ